jgi:pimeloyl-ACP methyl ester carboxylesterase
MSGWHRIDRGAGRPLLLLHGGGSSSRCWLPVIDRLATERRVIAFDFPGFGRTPPPDPTVTFSMDWAMDELGAELARLGIDTPVDIAGNSMGGWMALEAAKRGMARSVVAIGPAGLWAKGLPRTTRMHFTTGLCAARVAVTPAGRILANPLMRALSLFLVAAHPKRMTANEAIGVFEDVHASAPTLRKALRLGAGTRFEGGQAIDVPVTIAFGSHDRMVPARNSRHVDQLPAHARWVTLPDCGHVPMFDDAALVARTILHGTSGESSRTSKFAAP